MLSPRHFRIFFCKQLACFRFASSASEVKDDGVFRSIYCKPQVTEVIRDGKPHTIRTGLVDQSTQPLGDQFVTFQMKLSYKHDLDFRALMQLIQRRVKERNKRRQIISDAAVQHLGVDLAVAHMICNIGGRVQFVGRDKWFQRYANMPAGLPRRYVGDLRIESIDLSGTNVVYEGFELMPELKNLRNMRLRRCVHVDDFCLSRVARVESLQLLDIGECPRMTSKGVAALAQLKNLRRLFIQNNPLMEDKELVCLMLEDHLPRLYIDGVNYLGELPKESQRKIIGLVTDGSRVLLADKSTPEEQPAKEANESKVQPGENEATEEQRQRAIA
ncbi:unnamed protein product [Calicophoron daubneyi]|uniref:Mitochondrial ATP synthase regulatory component factor B n=1 Tax=Calicophoron daubneyi TaxID=300641 RepID=A0AAV2TDZ8_CALDB